MVTLNLKSLAGTIDVSALDKVPDHSGGMGVQGLVLGKPLAGGLETRDSAAKTLGGFGVSVAPGRLQGLAGFSRVLCHTSPLVERPT